MGILGEDGKKVIAVLGCGKMIHVACESQNGEMLKLMIGLFDYPDL